MAKVKVFVHATDADADADGRAMTLAPRTYLSWLAKNVFDRNHTFLRIFQSVVTIKFWHRHFQKGYLKSISKLLEKFVKFERKNEIRPPQNIDQITQFSGSGKSIIWHQDITASKMAFEGLKLRYLNTTASVLGKNVNFLIVC